MLNFSKIHLLSHYQNQQSFTITLLLPFIPVLVTFQSNHSGVGWGGRGIGLRETQEPLRRIGEAILKREGVFPFPCLYAIILFALYLFFNHCYCSCMYSQKIRYTLETSTHFSGGSGGGMQRVHTPSWKDFTSLYS